MRHERSRYLPMALEIAQIIQAVNSYLQIEKDDKMPHPFS